MLSALLVPVAAPVAARAASAPPPAPVSTGSAAGVGTPTSGQVARDGEVSSLRRATSRTYVSGHAYKTLIFPTPVNYRDTSGAWQKIDDSLIANPAGSGWRNRADRYALTVPSDASGAVGVAVGGFSVSMALQGATGAGSVSGATVTYPDALPGVTLTETATGQGPKETLSLASAAAGSRFTFSLGLPSGARLVASGGGLEVLDATGTARLRLPTPVVRDSGSTVVADPGPVSYTLGGTAAAPTVTLTVNPGWLAAPARVFPVVVDPSVTLSDTGDSYIEGGSQASTNFDGVTPMCIGYDGTYTAYQRVLMSYDVTGNLPPEVQVLNADLGLYVTSNTGSVSITALGLSRAFTPSGVTWNTYDGTNSWTNAGGDTISGGPTVAATVTTTSGYAHLYPTALVAAWLHGDHPQDGFLIKATSETSSAGKLCVTDNTAPAGQTPYLTVYWQMPTGDRPIATYRSYPVDDKETVKVDVVSGNAVLEANDDSVTGVGQNFQLTRAYNSGAGPYNLTGYLGQGWGLSPSSDTSLGVWGDGSITYYGPTGTAWTFTPTGDGSHFTAPPGSTRTWCTRPGRTATPSPGTAAGWCRPSPHTS
ncbi:MAG TPA: DNRLRE domain-containing protein [Mycobacteriales bacterium]|nr:DNRLRE domain-containing protein [Mycobacteriales bacterium]